MNGEPLFFLGCDLSAGHGAFVLLDAVGGLQAWTGFTFKKKDGALPLMTGLPLPAKNTSSNQKEFDRLFAVRRWLDGVALPWIDSLSRESHGRLVVVLEDYAYHGYAGQHAIAQVGGIFRSGLLLAGRGRIQIRMLIPGDVGALAVGNANAAKDCVQPAIAEMFPSECLGLPQDSEGDLRDALALAKIGHAENEVRAGRQSVESLSPGLRRVFLRTSGKQPENLLSRAYVK